MKPAITRAGWIRIGVVAAVGICLLPFTPGFKQQRNLHLARVHADELKLLLSADTRFKRVRLEPYTGHGGSLMVSATINNDEDKLALKKIIAASNPPVDVVYVFSKSEPPEAKPPSDETK